MQLKIRTTNVGSGIALFRLNILLVMLFEYCIILCRVLAKNGSFGFANGSALCFVAKVNVPLVRLAKIVFKKCAVGKNKNTKALAFGSAV